MAGTVCMYGHICNVLLYMYVDVLIMEYGCNNRSSGSSRLPVETLLEKTKANLLNTPRSKHHEAMYSLEHKCRNMSNIESIALFPNVARYIVWHFKWCGKHCLGSLGERAARATVLHQMLPSVDGCASLKITQIQLWTKRLSFYFLNHFFHIFKPCG